LDNPQHVEKVRQVFRAANEHGMAMVVHMRSSVRKKRPYSAKEAGSYDDASVDEALKVFVAAIAQHDPRMPNVYFDVSGVAGYGEWEKKTEVIAARIRQLGVERVLFGSDGFVGRNLALQDAWAAFWRLPLSEEEFRTIATNVTPYMR
jgi:amidohydrolase family protein